MINKFTSDSIYLRKLSPLSLTSLTACTIIKQVFLHLSLENFDFI